VERDAVERDAVERDAVEKAAEDNKQSNKTAQTCPACPGAQTKSIVRSGVQEDKSERGCGADKMNFSVATQLNQWPVQIRLVPAGAPYFKNANLLVAADCAAYAYGNFHAEYMKNRITIIGCPKLDDTDYSDKLTEILMANDIKSVTVARMEVPCCGGIENAVKTALRNCGKMIPWQVVTISTDGQCVHT
jgi:hypothetical protein